LIDYLYADSPRINPAVLVDVNSDGNVNILDITYLIMFIYLFGPQPDCPD
jgi:hypothetical protein